MNPKILFFAATFCFSAAITAQNATQSLTVAQAVDLGLAHSKTLRMDTLKLEQARIKQQQVTDAALPNAGVTAGYTRLSPVDPLVIQLPNSPEPIPLFPVILNNYTTRASISQPVFSGFRLKYSQESYGYVLQATQLDLERDANEVKFNVMSAFIAYAKLQMSRTIVAENLVAAKQRVTDIAAQLQQGTATDNDLLKAQLYQSNIELALADIDNTISVAQFNLGILLGLPSGTTVQADTTGLFATINLLPEQAYEADALSNRAEKKAAESRTNAAQVNEKVAQAAYYPMVSVGANYTFARPNQRIIPYVDEFRGTWDVGVTMSWSVTSLFTAKHSVQDAAIQTEQIQTQTEILDDNIRMEVFQNYAAVLSAIDKIRILELALKQAEENSRQVKVRYKEQMSLMSDVLDADAAVMQARVNLVLQRAEQTTSYYRLIKSTGKL